jgi:plasmid stabilization system protein ParE
MALKSNSIIIKRRARISIREIFEYVKNKEKSASIAKYVTDAIFDKCTELQDFSGYSIEPQFADYPNGNLYSVPLWNYKILYTKTNKTIIVLDVISGRKNPDNRIKL